MGVLSFTIGFFAIQVAVLFVTDKFVIPRLPGFIQDSVFILRIIGYVTLFIAVWCFIAWGYGHTVVILDNNDPFLNPLRWIWWVLAALIFGIAQAFLAEERVAISKRNLKRAA
ncbi:MAG: hypothetical protein AAF267_20805 [Deinococcota bacterium]